MTEDIKHVETFPAGEFVCDDCGRNSFFSLIAVEDNLTQEELNDFYMKVNGEVPPEGASAFWMMHPLVVKCQHCGTQFSTFQKEMEDGITEDSDE